MTTGSALLRRDSLRATVGGGGGSVGSAASLGLRPLEFIYSRCHVVHRTLLYWYASSPPCPRGVSSSREPLHIRRTGLDSFSSLSLSLLRSSWRRKSSRQ
jgi:hypothetical protein